jgi:BRCT domain type II-containing protein
LGNELRAAPDFDTFFCQIPANPKFKKCFVVPSKYVVVGSDAGSKLKKAKELGINTIEENDLRSLFEEKAKELGIKEIQKKGAVSRIFGQMNEHTPQKKVLKHHPEKEK